VLVVAVVPALGACGSTTPRCTIDVAVPADPPPFLWRVTRPPDGTVVWLYGTIHNAGEREVAPAAWPALASAPRMVSELGDRDPDADQLAALARIPAGKTLDHLLPADDWYDLRDLLRGRISEDELRHYRPWYAMARLTAQLAPSPTPTMDVALVDRARRDGKPIDALETWREQLEVLAAAVGVDDLRDAIRARHRMRCELDGMRAFYAAGDLDAMRKWLAMPRADQLLGARNRKWLAAIERYAATGGAFVAVGLGHLIGDASLPSLLVERGYTVERVRR
jgi:uncharacterized protein